MLFDVLKEHLFIVFFINDLFLGHSRFSIVSEKFRQLTKLIVLKPEMSRRIQTEIIRPNGVKWWYNSSFNIAIFEAIITYRVNIMSWNFISNDNYQINFLYFFPQIIINEKKKICRRCFFFLFEFNNKIGHWQEKKRLCFSCVNSFTTVNSSIIHDGCRWLWWCYW